VTAAAELAVLENAARSSFATAAELDWQSHDPFDLLLSPMLGGLRRTPLLARIAVQVGRRSGRGVRRFLRVPRHEEAKALADYLRAAVLLRSGGAGWADGWIDPLTARLRGTGTSTDNTCGWGLSFPYVSRFTNVDRGIPNTYVTTAAAEALLAAATVTGDPDALNAARAGTRFLVERLGVFSDGKTQWIRYWPDADARIVNIQASAASLLVRAGAGDDELLRVAAALAATAVAAQRPDGSWPYSEEPTGTFVDGFHTGFILQGLTEYRDACADPRVDDAIERGLAYFHEHLLTDDGLPRGFAGGRVSLDTQNVAQCIQTLVICARGDHDVTAAATLWDATTVQPAKFTALRWSSGPRALATAYLLRALTARRV